MTSTAPLVRRTPVRTSSCAALLASAEQGLQAARLATSASERYAAAHLAALRGAAAVLAARARPTPPGQRPSPRRPASAWVLLEVVAPELGEWAAFFAAGARTRAIAEAGLAVPAREADDLLRDAEAFLEVVATTLGLLGPDSSDRSASTDHPAGPRA